MKIGIIYPVSLGKTGTRTKTGRMMKTETDTWETMKIMVMRGMARIMIITGTGARILGVSLMQAIRAIIIVPIIFLTMMKIAMTETVIMIILNMALPVVMDPGTNMGATIIRVAIIEEVTREALVNR